MIKLFSMKNQKKESSNGGGGGESEAQSSNSSVSSNSYIPQTSNKRSSAAQLRITKDMNELTLPSTCQLEFPDRDDLLNFKLVVCPDEV